MKASHPILAACIVLLPAIAHCADWPQWRGPKRDGVITDPARKLDALPDAPRILWQVPVGPGQASPVLAKGKLLFLDGVDGQETAHCLDIATGKELWKTPIGPMVEFQNAYGEGPRCTPLIDGDLVFVQSCGGEFRCLSLADGKPLWSVSFEKDYGARWFGNKSPDPEAKETASRRHGNNGSPIVDGDRVFVPVGSPKGATLVAFNKKTGKELWRAGNDNTAYSSLMVADLAGTRQVVHFTADALMGVDAANGKILWREPLKTGAKRHVATPVIDGDTVTVTSTSIGTIRFRIGKDGSNFKATRDWENKRLKTIIGTPTQLGSGVYTIGPGARCDLVCIDSKTGEEKWAQSGLGDYASITAVNDSLLVLDATGELRLVRANPARYEELGRTQLCGKTWASPAYADGKIYVKDGAKLIAYEIAPAGTP